jgi:putative membrane protein
MIIIWVLIVAGVVFLIRSLVRRPSEHHPGYWGPVHYGPGGPGAMGPGPGMGGPEALRLLEERYARGEINREEFLQKKADLTGQSSGSTGQPTGQPPG